MALLPIVPFAPGVPALARDVLNLIGAPDLLSFDTISSLLTSSGTQWGVFQNGQPIIECDNVVSLEYRKDYVVADAPQEEGAFESYDKVETPYEARVRFSAGGSTDKLASFLASVEAVIDTVELYDVVTPQRIYEGANLSSMSYVRRANGGVGLMTIDVRIVEVRVTATSEFSNTREPNGASQVNDGVVQPSNVQSGSSLDQQVNSVGF